MGKAPVWPTQCPPVGHHSEEPEPLLPMRATSRPALSMGTLLAACTGLREDSLALPREWEWQPVLVGQQPARGPCTAAPGRGRQWGGRASARPCRSVSFISLSFSAVY